MATTILLLESFFLQSFNVSMFKWKQGSHDFNLLLH